MMSKRMPNVELVSSDGDVFEVDLKIARQSVTIANMLDELGDLSDEYIPLPIGSDVLAKVFLYLRRNPGPLTPVPLKDDWRVYDIDPWVKNLFDVDQIMLLRILEATHYLDIEHLMDVIVRTIANMIRGKTSLRLGRQTIHLDLPPTNIFARINPEFFYNIPWEIHQRIFMGYGVSPDEIDILCGPQGTEQVLDTLNNMLESADIKLIPPFLTKRYKSLRRKADIFRTHICESIDFWIAKIQLDFPKWDIASVYESKFPKPQTVYPTRFSKRKMIEYRRKRKERVDFLKRQNRHWFDTARDNEFRASVSLFEYENVQRFLGAGISPSLWKPGVDKPNGLMMSASIGKTAMVAMLMRWGAELESANDDHMTALHFAAKNVHADVVDVLLERWTDVDMVTKSEGLTPLMMVILRGAWSKDEQERIVAALLEKGADVTAVPKDSKDTTLFMATKDISASPLVVELLIGKVFEIGGEVSEFVNTKGDDGKTPFDNAMRRLNLEVMEILLNNGAHPSFSSFSGVGFITDVIAMVRLLLDFGADPNEVTPDTKSGMLSMLGIAVWGGNIELIRILLDAGADPNIVIDGSNTPLMYVAFGRISPYGQPDFGPYEEGAEIAQLLIEKGADVTMKNDDGYTALDIAKMRGHGFVVRVIERSMREGRPSQAKLRDAFKGLTLSERKAKQEWVVF